MQSWARISYAVESRTAAMDLVEELLDLSNQISAQKIKKLFDAISNHIPHMLLPTLGLREGCLNSEAYPF